MITEFPHIHSAHCETGALSGLLRYNGLNISEPLMFGIGSAMFFAYMPYLKYNSIPFIAFRTLPGRLIKTFNKRFNIELVRTKYISQKTAMDDLDKILNQNIPVGLVTNLFYIPYFPESYRFHFNSHNLIIYGKENDSYLVSDPIFEEPAKISYEDLVKARFSVGIISLKGNLYYIKNVPQSYDLEQMILDGIKASTKNMLSPMPLNGYKGIRYLSKRIKKWPENLDEKMAKRYLGNIIRMLEEVGTGGSGFRYMYAAFLQESAGILKSDLLIDASKEMTLAGDTWREFSYKAAIICKTSDPAKELYNEASEIIFRCSEIEESVFKKLSKLSV
jgi:hypothetical protein